MLHPAVFWFLVLGFWSVSPTETSAQVTDYSELRELEKVALALTAMPLNEEMRTKVISGDWNRDRLISELIKTENFVRHFGRYWAGKMGFTSANGGGILSLRRPNARQNLLIFARGNARVHRFDEDSEPTTETINEMLAETLNRKGRLDIQLKKCRDYHLIYHKIIDTGKLRQIIESKKYLNGEDLKHPLEWYETLYERGISADPPCNKDADKKVAINPSWAADTGFEWKAAKYIVPENRCGKDVAKCFAFRPNNSYRRGIAEDSSLEPGYLVGMVVADGMPFSSVLSTTKTVMTERYAHFMHKYYPWGSWKNFPGIKFKEDNENRYLNPSATGRDLFWVERGPKHAGVLTTAYYNLSTNGRRAKANRAFEAFLCSKFVVPKGVIADPSDINPDLRKRTYCAACHKTLEPMASFWNRFPPLGDVNLAYNTSQDVNDAGFFDGKEGKGVEDFGRILGESEPFKTCAVKRSFQFLYGRYPTKAEESSYLPSWVKVYRDSAENLAEVLRAMIDHEAFSQQWGGQ